jgi:hypothetical protein
MRRALPAVVMVVMMTAAAADLTGVTEVTQK